MNGWINEQERARRTECPVSNIHIFGPSISASIVHIPEYIYDNQSELAASSRETLTTAVAIIL